MWVLGLDTGASVPERKDVSNSHDVKSLWIVIDLQDVKREFKQELN